jgi:hypothetical protein
MTGLFVIIVLSCFLLYCVFPYYYSSRFHLIYFPSPILLLFSFFLSPSIQEGIYIGKCIRITSDLSGEALQCRKTLKEIFQVLRVNNCQPRLLYLGKTFQDKHKLKQLMTICQYHKRYLKGSYTQMRKKSHNHKSFGKIKFTKR